MQTQHPATRTFVRPCVCVCERVCVCAWSGQRRMSAAGRPTSCVANRSRGKFAARHGASLDQFVIFPQAGLEHSPILVPLDAESVAIARGQLALVHVAVLPRERTQAAELAVHEIAHIATAVKRDSATSVHFTIAPLAAGRLRAARMELDAFAVRSQIRVELADEVAAAGQKQRALGIGRASCSSDTRRQKDRE